MQKTKKSCNFGEKIASIDKFGQSFNLRFDEGQEVLPSKKGAVCTILIFILMLAYTGYRSYIIHQKIDIDVTSSLQEFHFNDTYTFGGGQGLNIAVYIVDPTDYNTLTMHPSYGRLEFKRRKDWHDG